RQRPAERQQQPGIRTGDQVRQQLTDAGLTLLLGEPVQPRQLVGQQLLSQPQVTTGEDSQGAGSDPQGGEPGLEPLRLLRSRGLLPGTANRPRFLQPCVR
ncbi:MAG: hypothetical protein LC808_33630, partial [Actinobacteria bacterium]|nr:hypothetical protein [Actinomycetota bacterium]